jgi:hypothetical protein
MALEKWALPQLSKLLPLDEESLIQIISYTDTLPKDAAAEHLKNLLGDSPQALEFISTFNTRRQAPASASTSGTNSQPREDISQGVPKPKHRTKKNAVGLKKLPPPRRPEVYGDVAGGYIKKDEEDYMAGKLKARKEPAFANALALQPMPDALQVPLPSSTGSSNVPSRKASPKLPPSAAGRLISDSKPSSRSSSPASKGKTKVSITGGTPMHGQSTALTDLESAIRELEIQTNPSLSLTSEQNARRRCNCMAQRHPLLEAAPNCLNCGKIICVKEGLGPCTFCGSPLLSSEEIQSMIRILREERGKEKMEVNNASHKRADVAKAPRPFSSSHLATPVTSTPASSAPSSDSESEKLVAAKQHRDKLLAFQNQNARRTRIHDEAADFETPTAGQNMWASPAERALQLKKQQKVLREQEWNARPEWEKRRVVASLDLVGGKVVKRMAEVERPRSPPSEEEEMLEEPRMGGNERGKGVFSKNPLLGSLIRPVAKVEGGGKGKEKAVERSTWRRVQDDNNDNEQWILDGGLYGGDTGDRVLGAEESAAG